MRCIGGSIEVWVRSNKWVKRKLWIDTAHDDVVTVFVVYVQRRGDVFHMYSDGRVASLGYWRWIKPPEGFEVHHFGTGKIVHVRDIVKATKLRLEVA